MKNLFVIPVLLALITAFVSGQATEPKTNLEDINIGKVYFPRSFVHEGKDFSKGVYTVVLTDKEGISYFKISDKDGTELFEEMAIVKTYKSSKRKFRYRVRKGMLKGYEYFRIKVIKPGKVVLGYFLVKKSIKPVKKES